MVTTSYRATNCGFCYAGFFNYDDHRAYSLLADKIVRMDYDIQVGAVLGLPGKLLAFFASLIAASLPVTGFIIWWGRKKKAKATGRQEVQNRFAVAELSQ